MTTWYDPDELRTEADGDQTQPEFTPEATEGYDEIDYEGDPDLANAWETRAAEIQAEIDGITQAYPTVSGDDPISL